MTVAVVSFFVCVIGAELTVLSALNAKTGWVSKRRTRILVIVVATSVLLTIQVGFAGDMISYEQGEIGYSYRGGDCTYDEYIGVQPGETRMLGTVSNWNTVVDLEVHTRPSVGNAILYFVDENRPEVNYTSEHFSWTGHFLLPYLYTSLFVTANWTANLYNPSVTEPARIHVEIHTVTSEPGNVAIITVSWHILPLIVLPVLAVYIGLSLILTEPTMPHKSSRTRAWAIC